MKEPSKILIVEDEFIIADQLKTLLESEGYIIVGIVDNYNDAIEIINEFINTPLFSYHKSNNFFAWPFKTTTMQTLCELRDEYQIVGIRTSRMGSIE